MVGAQHLLRSRRVHFQPGRLQAKEGGFGQRVSEQGGSRPLWGVSPAPQAVHWDGVELTGSKENITPTSASVEATQHLRFPPETRNRLCAPSPDFPSHFANGNAGKVDTLGRGQRVSQIKMPFQSKVWVSCY